MFPFEGRKVLVTGGAGGLGYAIVKKFLENGATVFALDNNEQRLKDLQTELTAVKIVHADLSKWKEVRETVENLGPMDHLVNNAGIAKLASCLETTEEQIDEVFSVNFKAALNLSQVFAKQVISHDIKDATIVNVSSTGAKMVLGHIGPAYCCSKAAMDMMTKTFAVELGSYGIRVNSVNPTLMNTPLILSAEPDTREKSYLSIARAPIHGLLDPSDAANLVLYLSSKNSKMITGSSVPIEGGLLSS